MTSKTSIRGSSRKVWEYLHQNREAKYTMNLDEGTMKESEMYSSDVSVRRWDSNFVAEKFWDLFFSFLKTLCVESSFGNRYQCEVYPSWIYNQISSNDTSASPHFWVFLKHPVNGPFCGCLPPIRALCCRLQLLYQNTVVFGTNQKAEGTLLL